MNTGLFDPRGGAGEISDAPTASCHETTPYDLPLAEPGLAFSRLMDIAEFNRSHRTLHTDAVLNALLLSDPESGRADNGQHVGAIWPWLNPRRTPLANDIERGAALRDYLGSPSFATGSERIVELLAAMAGITSQEFLKVIPFTVSSVWLPNATVDTRPGLIVYSGEPCDSIHEGPHTLRRECLACLNRCVPHRLHYGRKATRADFAVAWWEYLDMRWRIFGEWPSTATQLATLDNLRLWHRPIDCLRQSIAGSYKAIYPLRDEIDLGMYRSTGYAIRTTRRERSQSAPWVRDTVRSFKLVGDWRERLGRSHYEDALTTNQTATQSEEH